VFPLSDSSLLIHAATISTWYHNDSKGAVLKCTFPWTNRTQWLSLLQQDTLRCSGYLTAAFIHKNKGKWDER
jgi:hypothetical protein